MGTATTVTVIGYSQNKLSKNLWSRICCLNLCTSTCLRGIISIRRLYVQLCRTILLNPAYKVISFGALVHLYGHAWLVADHFDPFFYVSILYYDVKM